MTLETIIIVIFALAASAACLKFWTDRQRRLEEAKLLKEEEVKEFKRLLEEARSGSQEALDEFKKKRDAYVAKYNAANKSGGSNSTH